MAVELSIVIPTHNRRELLERCVNGVLRQGYPQERYEIIVIDDGSSDGTKEYLENESKSITNVTYVTQDNLGHSAARNAGFLMAKGEIIVSLDDDCVPLEGWLRAIVRHFEQNPDSPAVCGRILNPTNTKIAWAQYFIDFSLWMGLAEKDIRIAYTANIAYRKKAIKGLSFREDGLYLGYRDCLFNYALAKRGRTIRYCPGIKVLHYKWECSRARDKRPLFIEGQIRHGRGFRSEGHKIYGRAGYVLTKLPAPLCITMKAAIILYRAFFAGLLGKCFSCFGHIILGLRYQCTDEAFSACRT